MTENVHRIDGACSTKERAAATTHEFLAEMKRQGMSQNAAARKIGVSATQLSQWLNARYPGDVPALEENIGRWLHTQRQARRHSLEAAGLDLHRDLDVTDEIAALLAHAQAVGDVVLIHGVSGAGKTWSVRHYCRTHSTAFYVDMTPSVLSLNGLLGRVGEMVGAGGRHGSAVEAETAIVNTLRDRGALICCDEAHHLSARLLDQLRRLRDISGCGLALIGDSSVRMTLARCPQIVGRIGGHIERRSPSEPDVEMLVAGILGRAPAKRELKAAVAAARGPGGLHALRRMLARAWMSARTDGREKVEAGDIEAASLHRPGLTEDAA